MNPLNAEIGGLPAIVLILGLGAAFVVTLVGLAVVSSGGDRRRRERRLQSVVHRTRQSEEKSRLQITSVRQKSEDSGIPLLDGIVRRLLPRPHLLRKRLRSTGLNIKIGHYLLACLATMPATVLIVIVAAGLPLLLAAPIGVIVGVGLPHMVIGIMVKRRQERFIGQFPEAIDLIVRGLKSGLPVTESVRTVGSEIPKPVGGEFRQIMEHLALGKTLEEAMWLATERIDIPEFRFFVVSLSVQRETGGNLAETLENLAEILRKRRQTKLKIRALSSEARASALIIGALPFIMFVLIWMVNSEYLLPLFTDLRGNIMLGIGLFWLFTGFGVMAKMVRFEI